MTEQDGAVSRDGSPVPVFLALPPTDAPRLIHAAIGPSRSILELGCGAGRLTRPLVAMGHEVVAVDDSPAMLSHVTGAGRVCADLFDLRLNRRFDAVVAPSYLVNTPDDDRRRALLDVCRHHVTGSGAVLLQRHDPVWTRDPVDGEAPSGPVDIRFRLLDKRPDGFDGLVTYRLGGQSWDQMFAVRSVGDDDLRAWGAVSGLRLERWLDDDRTWALLRPEDA